MLNSIGALLKIKKRPEISQLNYPEMKLTTARLMLEVIRADGYIGKIELITMSEVLKREFKLTQNELNSLFNEIANKHLDEQAIEDITSTICETWGNAKRVTLLENLWIVALADQDIHDTESNLVRKLASLLCLNEMQIFRSQENAKLRLGIEDF